MTSQVFCFLGEASFSDQEGGRKASQLHELLKAGFQVPPGFVVSEGIDLEQIDLQQLQQAVDQIGGFPVAVRSSGNLEDLNEASFAGQYVTFLEVSGIEELIAKIRLCRQAANSDIVRAYLKKKGISTQGSRLSVLVQRMIQPEIAGVAFSIHPLTGKEEHGLIEFCKGLGEKLVSGQVTPSRATVSLRDGSIVEEVKGSDLALMSAKVTQQLTSQIFQIQAYFGSPQDIEWAMDGMGSLWILQSRPITKIQWRKDIDEYSNADFKDGGVSARVCTPLMFSLYHDVIQLSLPGYFESIKLGEVGNSKSGSNKEERSEVGSSKDAWVIMAYGRPYWNASAIKRRLFRIPGFDERAFDQDLGVQKNYGKVGPVQVPKNLRTILPAIPVAIALESQYKRHLKIVEEFRESFKAADISYLRKIQSFDSTPDKEFFSDLVVLLEEFYLKTETNYFKTIYNNSNAQSEFKDFIRDLDKKTVGQTSLVSLMSGLSDISHLEMQRGLLRLYQIAKVKGMKGKEWEEAFQSFVSQNYFHSDAELELKTPRWGEVPERIYEIVRSMLQSGSQPTDPDKSIQLQKKEFQAEFDRVMKRINQLKKSHSWFTYLSAKRSFQKHLNRVRTYLSRREEMREYSTRCYYVVRCYVLEAGRRLARIGVIPHEESIFMLHRSELLQMAYSRDPEKDVRELITYRNGMYQGYRNFTPPNELGMEIEQNSVKCDGTMKEGNESILVGLGCSPGQVEGTARVIESLQDIGQIQQGDILITKFTDPGWTPALGLVSGIVTEVGGMLSHAAVISREYGIPAVLNLPGVTKRISNGSRVRLDGTSGKLEICGERSIG